MTAKHEQKKQEIIAGILQYATKRIPKNKLGELPAFIEQFFYNVPFEDLEHRNTVDLFGMAFSLWDFIYTRKQGECKIRVYNPTFEQHGWESTHTIIEISHDDMPFIVDSISMEVNRLGMLAHLIVHIGCFNIQRDKDHKVSKILSPKATLKKGCQEAIVYFEVDRQTDKEALEDICDHVKRVMADVEVSVADWQKMRNEVEKCLYDLETSPPPLDKANISESIDFLRWVLDDHFTFLGYREYKLVGEGKAKALEIVPQSGLGVLRESSTSRVSRHLSELPKEAREMTLSPEVLIIAKTNTKSTVHRPAYTDYIGVKYFDKKGKVVSEKRFVGLYTSAAYHSNPKTIPFLRHKVETVLANSRLSVKGHSGKALVNILETLPRDDLFQASDEELYELAMGILHLQERQRTRLFIRKDSYGRYYSCLVYVPRELFNTELRMKLQKILEDSFHSVESFFTTRFTESILARIHYVIRVNPNEKLEYDPKEIEEKLVLACRSWKDELKENATEHFGEAKGISYYNKYKDSFSFGYREQYDARTGIYDIEHIERLSSTHTLEMSFHRAFDDLSGRLQLKLFNPISSSPLSDVLPILENLGLRVLEERPSNITFQDGTTVWVNDFEMVHFDNKLIDVDLMREKFQEAFKRVWFEECENDPFNRLILVSRLSWKEVVILRAYAKYLKQIGFTFSQDYIAEAFYHHPEITHSLVQLFIARFNPETAPIEEKVLGRFLKKIEKSLDAVISLDEDRILRRMLALILATLRTNYFVKNADGSEKTYLSLKLEPSKVPDVPLPHPMFEIFVYAPWVEAVHLRGAKVARGGIRWSDRREDFRTEVLGLMKAQQVKNALIVPLGAKGGFVAKTLPVGGSREEIMDNVISCYKTFMRAMLDITDNIVEQEVVHPKDVIFYDEEDPYLVVAADKGTATFSDIANGISEEYGFWLGDAFASGGSVGYDHKKMGITARGAWESCKRHFREMGIDTQSEPFTVVGVGDMSGDVFGNGMLLSPCIKLIGAFNHLDIFVDPTPDPAISFEERKRLFHLPRSSWSDYDPNLLSKGGAIYSRAAKSITVTPEIAKVLDIKNRTMEPNELIRYILKAKIDLFWNGGIGTFMKSKFEQHSDVGDRTNDGIRIDATELRAKVVVEGGNLGLTQRARIEYASLGGRINTDAIDNSAGVDCSDHEVNIKILLNSVVNDGDLTQKQRNQLLEKMTNEVATLVLKNNYHQTETLSLEEFSSAQTLDLFRRFQKWLETEGRLNRELECLPDKDDLQKRQAEGKGFFRPETSILFAHDKIWLKEQILNSALPEEPNFEVLLKKAFPAELGERYYDRMKTHSLRREIIATQLTNAIVNAMGINFVGRLSHETGAPAPFVVRAYMAAHALYDFDAMWEQIRALDCKVHTNVQFSMMLHLYFLARRTTRWFLRNCPDNFDVQAMVKQFYKPLQELKKNLTAVFTNEQTTIFNKKVKEFMDQGVPESLADTIGRTRFLFHSLDILKASMDASYESKDVAAMYFVLSAKFELSWLREKIVTHGIEDQWDELAKSSLMDELDIDQRDLALNVLKSREKGQSIEDCFEAWREAHALAYNRWKNFLTDMHSNEAPGLVMYSVALRELFEIANYKA